MQQMNEADIYNYLIKDGDSLASIRKNTEMLRQRFKTEYERTAHTLKELDPHNQDRHEAEASRIRESNSQSLDRVLMHIAATSPQKMPLPVEAINRASEAARVPKAKAKAVLSVPVILFAAFPAALFYEVILVCSIGAIVVVAAIVNAVFFKIDTSGLVAVVSELDRWLIAKVVYGICYIVGVVVGFSHIRGGGTLGEAFNMLFTEPLLNLLSGVSGGKK